MAATRILPVEDERIVARDLQVRLRQLGYDVPRFASSKSQAIEFLEIVSPDLVLMDIRLNGQSDGIEAAQEIRERFDVPVVYLTAHSDPETLERAKQTEPFGYVLKPFQDRELMAAIETAIYKHKTEKRLRETERWVSAVLSSIGDAVIATDKDGRVRFMNKVAEALTGRKEAEATEKHLLEVFRGADEKTAASLRDMVARVLQDGAMATLKEPTFLTAADGTETAIADSAAPIKDDRGENSGLVLVFRDVSEKLQAHNEIRARSLQQAAANQLGQRALADLELPALMDEACATIQRLLEIEFCEVLELLPDGESLLLRAGCGWRDGLVGSATLSVRSSHAGHVLELSGPALIEDFRVEERFETSPLLRDHGAVSGASVVIGSRQKPYGVLGAYSREKRRLTPNEIEFIGGIANILGSAVERKQGEEALKKANWELQAEIEQRQAVEQQLIHAQKMEALGRLAGGVAHDFNNLLTAITGYTDMLQQELREPELVDFAQQVLDAAERATTLTQQLLAFSRRQMSCPAILDLNQVIRQIEKMLRRVIGEDIKFVSQLTPDIARVKADPGHIDQVILNLAVNARDAMPNGGTLVIETSQTELTGQFPEHQMGAPPGPYVVFAVSDTGVGMDAETKRRLFEPFFTTKGQEKGTGLGLSIVYGIVSQCGGDISVYSELGRGTTIRVFLPALAQEPEVADATPRIGARRPATGTETILIAEDEDSVRHLVSSMLRRQGYTVIEAATPRDALRLAEQHHGAIDLILTDIIMPQMNGVELARRLGEIRPDLKILYMSGYTEHTLEETQALGGGARFIQKPFTAVALASKVREVLEAGTAAN